MSAGAVPGTGAAPASARAGVHMAQRLFSSGEHDFDAPLRDAGAPLELTTPITDPPRVIAATVIEGSVLREIRIVDEPVVAFDAFLDGTQQSRVVHYAGSFPIVLGTVAAVIRRRVGRRMVTWRRATIRQRLYLPKRLVPAAVWERALTGPWDPVDTTSDERDPSIEHPFELLQRAVHAVQFHREDAERDLAEDWVAMEKAPLFIDGGLCSGDIVAGAPHAVGVVKSHRSIYASGDALQTILALQFAHRSSIFRVTSSRRRPVASWYLRIRDRTGHDPMWGLIRVEMSATAEPTHPADLSARATEISRWILAETTPLSLPDSRWDKLVYGVRDCEEVLRAVSG